MPISYKILFAFYCVFVVLGFKEAYRRREIPDARSAFWTSWKVLTGRTLVLFVSCMVMDNLLSYPHPWFLAPNLDPHQFLTCCAFTLGQFIFATLLYLILGALTCALVAGMSSILSLPVAAWKPKLSHAVAALLCLTQLWMAVSLQYYESFFF